MVPTSQSKDSQDSFGEANISVMSYNNIERLHRLHPLKLNSWSLEPEHKAVGREDYDLR